MTNKNKKQEFDGLLLGTRIEKILEENYILDYEREIYSYQRKVWQWIEKKDKEQLDKIIKMIEGEKGEEYTESWNEAMAHIAGNLKKKQL